MKDKRIIKKIIALMLVLAMTAVCGCSTDGRMAELPVKDSLSHEGYTLEQVVVLSRHNIRAPLSGKGSVLDTITPYEWFAWSSDPSDLSVRGGVLEAEMGQYFRKWLEKEGLFPEDYQPEGDSVRIYSNSKQRTIATARFFSIGLLPVGDCDVEYHMEFDQMDPVFTPQLTFVTDEYREAAKKQMEEMFTDTISNLSDNYRLLEKVIDIKRSSDWKEGKTTGFKTDDTEFILEEGKEPGMSGSLKTACSVSDALVLQYYETDEITAAFGEKLGDRQWEKLAEIKDVYGDVLFTAPLIAENVAHPLLEEIKSELDTKERIFTFLCGHDSNLGSVLAALKAEDYSLPDAIEKKTPIGSKLVFSRWADATGKKYISVDLVYQTKDQLRELSLLDSENPPSIVHIRLKDVQENSDGLVEASKLEERIVQAIDAYDKLIETYGMADAA